MAAIADESSKGRPKAPRSSRTGPLRTGAPAPDPKPGDEPAPAPGNGAGEALGRDVQKAISDAVALGYSVIGDNLAHGRSVATRLSEGSYRLGHAADDVSTAGRRFVKLAGEIGQVWIDLVGAIARDPDLHAALSRRHPDDPRTGSGGWRFRVHVKSDLKVTAQPLTLDMSGAPDKLACAALTHQDGTGARISSVNIHVSKPDRHVFVLVEVPKGQAPGHYAGAVRTVPGGKLVGTLSLEVGA